MRVKKSKTSIISVPFHRNYTVYALFCFIFQLKGESWVFLVFLFFGGRREEIPVPPPPVSILIEVLIHTYQERWANRETLAVVYFLYADV